MAHTSDGSFSSAAYWNERYVSGGNSGAGSYNRLAEFKAEVLNAFVERERIQSVIEWGCGDGNQLRLARYPRYIGLDVSKEAVRKCRNIFKADRTKKFSHISVLTGGGIVPADLSLSLDVLYHLVEDKVFNQYMRRLFSSSKKYVCIYSCDFEKNHCAHVRCRKFTDWIERNVSDKWELVDIVRNKYPYDENAPDSTSWSDFYFYKKRSKKLKSRLKDIVKKFYPVPTRTAQRLAEQTKAEMKKEIAGLRTELAALSGLVQSKTAGAFVFPVPEHIVVSLTTYPARFGSVCHTLRTLLSQTLRPDRIIVYLDCAEREITDEMRSFVPLGVEYRFGVEDLRPHKKYFYAMQEFGDSIVVTADDDILYPPTMVEGLYRGYRNHPCCVVANRVHKILFDEDNTLLPYKKWVFECMTETEPRHDLFATGCGGVLYPPHLLPGETFNAEAIKELCLDADDIWLKFMELLAGVKVVWAANPRVHPPVVEGSQDVGLCKTNVEESMNDIQLANMIQRYGNDITVMKLQMTKTAGGGTDVE